ncbi:M16 family metallopeptidase [Fusobacterium sp. PH5-44]|uniref:M16 family metallopeptidase n=1 Tax=unclassified Fusobacterium TaxID=2648384 RepID=UPI003D1E62C2
MKKIITIMLMCLCFSSFSEEFVTSSELKTGTLSNGMKYYILKNKKPEKKALLNLVVKAGSTSEENGDEGIAHVIEHMAFNGTKKYKKNDMVKYLQSIGLNFGGDLNAYTSFDETVYKLMLPTDEPEKFEKGIEVLREWASEVTFDKNELEGEKKIVLEEWRLSQGLSQRISDTQKKAMLNNTRYFERFPIGLVKSIQETTSDNLKKYYSKWYHPENMSIIAVGDLDAEKTEELIKKYFNYKPKTEYTKPTQYTINKLKNRYEVFTDPEITGTSLYISKVFDREIIKSPEAYKRANIQYLLFNIINTRLSNMLTEEGSPLKGALIFSSNFNLTNTIISIGAAIKEKDTQKGLELIDSILKSSAVNGITQTELDLEKKNMESYFKNLMTNRDSIPHDKFAEELLEHILSGESFIGLDAEYKAFEKAMKEIQVKDLNELAKKIYNEESLYFLMGSSKNADIPTKEKLQNIFENARKNENIISFNVNKVELPPVEVQKGSILEKKDEFFTLSNGIKVATKKTDFDKDKIFIRLFKKEGSSNSTYDAFLNSIFATNIISNSGVHNLEPKDIDNFMKGKNMAIMPYIGDYEQGIEIISDGDGLIQALEYFTYLIKEPKVNEAIFNNTKNQISESIKNRKNSPNTLFSDEISRVYSGGHERRMPLTEDELKKITKEGLLSIYKEKFDNFNGFNLIVVGSYDEKELTGILEKYFASLPSSGNITWAKNLELNIPKDIQKRTVVSGIDKKASVMFIFPYNSIYGENERVLYAAYSKILNMSLTENIRESIGGVYSISSSPVLSPNSYGEDKLIIQFSCDTKRLDEIKKATLETVKKVSTVKADQEKIKSIRNSYVLTYRNDVLKNEYWLNYYYQKFTIGDTFKILTPDEYNKLVTPENLLEFSKKAINMNNYIDVTLLPEKEE